MGIIRQDFFYQQSTVNFPDSGTYVFGGMLNLPWVGASSGGHMTAPIAMTLKHVDIRCSIFGTLGSSELTDIEIDLNGGGGTVIGQITMDKRINYTSSDLNIAIAKNDQITFNIKTPAWVTNPTTTKGITVTCYFETGLERALDYQRWFYNSGGNGQNPAGRTLYFLSPNNLITTTQDHAWMCPYNGTIVGGHIDVYVQNNSSAETSTMEWTNDGAVFDTISNAVVLDGPGSPAGIVIDLDTLSLPVVKGEDYSLTLNTANWSVAPTGVRMSVGLLIERT